jgi:hypothetical protein
MIPSFGETTVPDRRSARFGSVRFRFAGADDAEQIAVLHADSWRRHYRGAYADSFLDGDVVADRRSVWSARLAASTNSETVLAEHDGRLVGFIHVVFDDDIGPRSGGRRAGAASASAAGLVPATATAGPPPGPTRQDGEDDGDARHDLPERGPGRAAEDTGGDQDRDDTA